MYEWIARLTGASVPMRWLRALLLRLPRPLVFAAVACLGWCIHACARRTRRTILRNLRTLLPHTTPQQRNKMCRQYLVHECLTIYEQTIEYRKALADSGPRRARFLLEGVEHVEEALRQGRGAIIYAPHVGNYFYFYWMMSQRFDCTTVVTAGSQELRELFVRVYSLGGMAGYDYDSETPRELAFKLRAHLKRNGVVFLLSDFWREDFPDCTLFGKPSKAPAGALTLALLQKTPVVPFHGRREGWFTHRMVFEPPLYLHERYDMRHKEVAMAAAMKELSGVMEHLIAQAPQQWLYWFNVHERWEAAEAAAEAAGTAVAADGVIGAEGATGAQSLAEAEGVAEAGA